MNVLKEVFLDALFSINAHKMRSMLTILGIIIGIMSVVTMVSVGQGVQNDVKNKFSSIGSNQLMVFPSMGSMRGVSTGTSNNGLTTDDAAAIQGIPYVKNVGYQNSSSSQIVYNNNNQKASINGVSRAYFSVMNIDVEKGSDFTNQEYTQGGLVAIIGSTLAEELFGTADPIGKIVHIKNVPVEIKGVLKTKGSGFGGQSQDDQIFVTYNTFMRRIMGSKFPTSVRQIVISGETSAYLSYIETSVTNLLRTNHKLTGNTKDDFNVRNLSDIVETANATTKLLTILLSSIASISLIVGSIGIMNMMLVTVTERTKEIGLRKAVGSTDSAILCQFLFESVLISIIGSIVGLILGVVLTLVLSKLFAISAQISGLAILFSIIVSFVVGIVSGIFPAFKAAKLNTIDALRYE